MKHNKSFLYKLPLFAVLCISASSIADDTEIYFDLTQIDDPNAFKPNVLFILDSSGSMSGMVTTTTFVNAYDPNTNYGSSNTTNAYFFDPDSLESIGFSQALNVITCSNLITALQNTDEPFFTDRMTLDVNGFVECESDNDTAINWSNISKFTTVSANYNDYLLSSNVTRSTDSKNNLMKSAATNLVNNFKGLNLGLMRFNFQEGGYVIHHFSDIETDSTNIITAINSIGTTDWTPLAETLWEADRYFKGESVDYGTSSNRDPNAVTGGNYNSPISGNTAVDCQSNYVVYLTDGEPTRDSGRDADISNFGDTCSHTGGSSADSTCLDEMSAYMASHDYNDNLDGIQSVKTFTIGFGVDLPLLEAAATGRTASGKGYFTANNSTELNEAFNQILTEIEQSATTFVAPAISVNAFNSLQNKNEVYYALFEPNVFPRWHGNVKKYKINSKGAILGQGMDLKTTTKDNDAIADEDDAPIEPAGYFLSTARSFWSDENDGPNVTLGGAANELSTTRTVYTIADNATLPDVPDPINLNVDVNIITNVSSKTSISNTLYGIKTSDYVDQAAVNAARQKLTSWILGIDVDDENENNDFTDANNFMPDQLHSRPSVVTYGGTESNPDDTLFSMGNGGAFRAIETDGGKELFAFIPPQLLKNQKIYYDNDANNNSGANKFVYGLDGPLTIWREERSSDDNNAIDGTDHVYAYFGMRRGGNNYYAMDVTDRDNPKLMWTIIGGSTTGFSDLGQTWSRPILRKVRWNCGQVDCDDPTKLTDVLFFAGGYDEAYDDESKTSASDITGAKGAAIYMVNATTGALLWSAGKNGHDLGLTIEHSIPGDLTAADMDGDGAVDILFAVDIAGHVWRVDFNSDTTSKADFSQDGSGNDTGGEIADLTSSEFRRFYVGPTVSLSQKRGRPPFFVLTMGTGYVAHPINTTAKDRIYAIFERNIFGYPKDSNGVPAYISINNSPLLDMTSSSSGPANPEGNAFHGFYKDATTVGEKFLRRALTSQGFTVYTSYIPKGVAVNTTNSSCGAAQLGTSRLFAMNFVTGVSAYTGEYIDLNHPGISADPVTLLIRDEDTGTIEKILCLGTECFNPDEEQNPFSEVTTQILYWRENIQ